MSGQSELYTREYGPRNIVGAVSKPTVTADLTEYKEVRIIAGKHYVATTPEHFVECMAWLLTNVDTGTLVTKDGIEVDESE